MRVTAMKRWFYALTATAVVTPVLASTMGPLVSTGAHAPDTLNQNFATVKTAVDDDHARIGDLALLRTTDRSNLVAAVNELRHPAPIILTGAQHARGGEPSNHWALPINELVVALYGQPVPLASVVGRPYTLTFELETADSASGQIGPPTTGGQLVLDLVWIFGPIHHLHQPAVATLTIEPGVTNTKTVTLSGLVPAPPATTNGGQAIRLFQGAVGVRAGAGTTAQGHSWSSLVVRIGP